MDTFTRAYIEAALWSSTDDNDKPLDENYTAEDPAPETLESMFFGCKEFQSDNAELLDDLDLEQAGHDFWLTRNRHGAGFWDGDYDEEIGEKLTEASHKFKEITLYIGDDNLIYEG